MSSRYKSHAPLQVRNLGINLRIARLEAGLSRVDLAELLSCSSRRIEGLEAGQHEPRFFLVVELARVLDVPLGRLTASPPRDWEDRVSDLEYRLRQARAHAARWAVGVVN